MSTPSGPPGLHLQREANAKPLSAMTFLDLFWGVGVGLGGG